MKVRAATTALYRIPRPVWWPLPIGNAAFEVTHLELLICEVALESGHVGMGYTYRPRGDGATVFASMCELAGRIAGSELDPVPAPLATVRDAEGTGGPAFAALDTAVWDALAIAAGLSLAEFIGTRRADIPCCAAGVDLLYSDEQIGEEVEEFIEQGFRHVKLKAGLPFEDDLRRVTLARRILGSGSGLMLDVNLVWTLQEAISNLDALSGFELTWVEDPCGYDLDDYLALRERVSATIALGKGLTSVDQMRPYVEAGVVDIVQPDVMVLGVSEWLLFAGLAEDAGLPVVPHSAKGIHSHLLCAIGNGKMLEHFPIYDHLMVTPLLAKGGVAAPAAGLGHGVRFKPAVLDAHRVAVVGTEVTER